MVSEATERDPIGVFGVQIANENVALVGDRQLVLLTGTLARPVDRMVDRLGEVT